MSVVVTRGHRKRWIVYVLGLIVAVPLACFLLLKDWHPDTSKVPSFAAYANTEADVLPPGRRTIRQSSMHVGARPVQLSL